MTSRYDKHIKIDGIGPEGQKAISGKKVVLIGCGALGSHIADLLVRSGVGEILIVDRDMVELGNLHRQVLFSENDIGQPKAEVAVTLLRKVNSEIIIRSLVKDVRNSNISGIVSGFDLIMDGTDNISVRMLINDISVKDNIPWIFGGVLGTKGMMMDIFKDGPCLRCLIPDIPEKGQIQTCETAGVINTIPAVTAAIQTTEALKILMGRAHFRGLLQYDIWEHEFSVHELTKDPECECCGKKEFRFLEEDHEESISVLCDDAVQIILPDNSEADLKLISENLKGVKDLKSNPFRIEFETEGKIVTVYKDGRVIIKGTEDLGIARSVYSKFLGL